MPLEALYLLIALLLMAFVYLASDRARHHRELRDLEHHWSSLVDRTVTKYEKELDHSAYRYGIVLQEREKMIVHLTNENTELLRTFDEVPAVNEKPTEVVVDLDKKPVKDTGKG